MADPRRLSVLPRALAASLAALGPAACFNPKGNADTDDESTSTTSTTSTTLTASATSTTRESTVTTDATVTTTDATHTSDPTGPMTTATASTNETSAGSTDATGSTTNPNVCGDGDIDAGEECDDGNQTDDDACLTTCVNAKCGDGNVWSGMEECDDANPLDGDGCTSACTREHYIFVTQQVQLGAIANGVMGADNTCRKEALMGTAPVKAVAETFIAWLSVQNAPMHTRITATKGPFRLPTGTVVAPDFATLENGPLMNPVQEDSAGTLIIPVNTECLNMGSDLDGFAWTGTIAGGQLGESCSNWTSADMNLKGVAGNISALGQDWTDACQFNIPCNKMLRLYCIQQ